jgi:hypothetical protein
LSCIPRQRRKDPIIQKNSIIFSKAMHEKDFDLAAKITFRTVLELWGIDGLMNAIDQANSFIKRIERRKGL